MIKIEDGVVKIKNDVTESTTKSEVNYKLPTTFSADSKMLRLQYTYAVPKTDDTNYTQMAYFLSTGWDDYASETFAKRYTNDGKTVDVFLKGSTEVTLHIYKNLNLDFTINSLIITKYKENDVNGDTYVDIRDLLCYKKS